MERFDVSEGDRFAEMVSAARAGVEVEITEGGEVVARMSRPARPSFREQMEAHWRSLPSEVRQVDWGAEIGCARSEDWE